MREFVARGFCGQQSFVVRPHAGFEIVSGFEASSEYLTIKTGVVELRIARRSWSRETDHWHETEYLCHEVRLVTDDTPLFQKKVLEFMLWRDDDTLILGLRIGYDVRADHVSTSHGVTTEVHLITSKGLYRNPGTQECAGCEIEDDLDRARFGCQNCLSRHMRSWEKQTA